MISSGGRCQYMLLFTVFMQLQTHVDIYSSVHACVWMNLYIGVFNSNSNSNIHVQELCDSIFHQCSITVECCQKHCYPTVSNYKIHQRHHRLINKLVLHNWFSHKHWTVQSFQSSCIIYQNDWITQISEICTSTEKAK